MIMSNGAGAVVPTIHQYVDLNCLGGLVRLWFSAAVAIAVAIAVVSMAVDLNEG